MKKSFFRAISFLLIAVMMLSMFSCGRGDDVSGENPYSSTSTLITTSSNSGNGGDVVKEEIKNIILIIGDGMGIEHISAGELFEGKNFEFTNWQYTSVNTDSVTTAGQAAVLTDSAAAGTALATGSLTVNGRIGIDHKGNEVDTILDEALANDKATGVVTTDTLFGATPSAFSAHNLSRNASDALVLSQLKSGVDLLCGHIDSKCTSRKNEIEDAGYEYCDNFSNIDDTLSADKAYWQFSLAGTTATTELCDVAVKALDFLDKDEDGFVLMIEQAYIDKYSHNNDFAGMVDSMVSLNDTVDAILEWLGDRTDTAILITADHETGGLTVSSDKLFSKSHGGVYYKWSKTDHTNSKVGLFVYGIEVDFSEFDYYGSQHLIKNIDVYNLMYNILDDPDGYVK